jgi:hypothetical protein
MHEPPISRGHRTLHRYQCIGTCIELFKSARNACSRLPQKFFCLHVVIQMEFCKAQE